MIVVTIVAALVLLYAGVVALYAVNDRAAVVQGCLDAPPSDKIRLSFTPEAVNAVGNRIAANLDVDSLGPIAAPDTGLLSDPLTIIVTDTDGPRTFEVAADEIPSPESVSLITEGTVDRWPFDTHTVEFAVVALQEVGSTFTPVPTVICGSANVPGWVFSSQNVAGTSDLVIDDEPVTQIRITAARSAATVAFGIVILVLMVVLPVLALTVAILAYRGKRKVEATLTSWMAAMLFATVPLRTFLPGSPPIGSWVDYLIVLWVVAGLVASLAIYVAAWVRWTPPGGRPAEPAAAIPVAVPVREADTSPGPATAD